MPTRAAKAVAGPLFSFLALVFLLYPSDPAVAFPAAAREGSPLSLHLGTADSGLVTSKAFPKWSGVQRRDWAWRARLTALCSYKMKGGCQLDRWQGFLERVQGADPLDRLAEINRYINRFHYRDDQNNWGELDYWAAPGEFFARGGDCEDYAIAKYYSLKLLGFPTDRMRIVVLNDDRRRIAHAVLEVSLGDRQVVLDNRSDRVLSWRDVGHYRPIYSVNEATYWLYAGGNPAADSSRQSSMPSAE